MCTVLMRVRCSDRFSELFVGDVECTELAIESVVGTALLELFDSVHVDDVTVQSFPEGDDGGEGR